MEYALMVLSCRFYITSRSTCPDVLLPGHLFAARTLPQGLSGSVKRGKSVHVIGTQIPIQHLLFYSSLLTSNIIPLLTGA